jgi:tripeptide aminopeptidase
MSRSVKTLKQSLVINLCLSVTVLAQTSWFTTAVKDDERVKLALKYIDDNKDGQIDEWIRISEVPGKSKHEQKRGAYIAQEMRKAGLDEVSVDEMGNVIGLLKGIMRELPAVVFAAHIDTVHPLDVSLKVRREGDKLYGPGIFDNSASCANMLQAIRALKKSGLKFKRDIVFVGTVQEEIGLRGMRHYLEKTRDKVGMLVALDGGLGSVSYGALGIHWLKYIYRGEGSHTVSSRGKPNPNKAVARAILKIYEITLPAPESKSTAIYNVGMIGGGKIFNAISQESYFTIDLRTTDPALLKELEDKIDAAAQAAATEERVELIKETELSNPAGGTEEQLTERRKHPIVQSGVDVLQYLLKETHPNRPVRAIASGSTDGNVGVEMGIPTIAVGRSFGGEQHTLQEWSDIPSAFLGTKQIILLAASLGGIDHASK